MSGSARLTEKWINRGLWLISLIFASFLIGLGSLIVEDLPKVQNPPTINEFIDQKAQTSLKFQIEQKEKIISQATDERNAESEKVSRLNSKYAQSKEVFNNWIATRSTTQDNNQNNEVLKRTRELETQQEEIKLQEERVIQKDQEISRLEADVQPSRDALIKMEAAAYEIVEKEVQRNQLKVFLYRLAITLPLLIFAAWIFMRKRKSQQWPFVWGFVFFAFFTFFVELVPYLPSYGGYVRYIVGIVVTYFIGRYSIKALQRYLENQRIAEAMPKQEIKETLNYDLAQQRISKGICPGCERPADVKDNTKNYCIHCGTCLFNQCKSCHTRKNAFAKFCHACGTVG